MDVNIDINVDINDVVPQGSILGKLFFLVFIDEIILGLETNPYLFADDTFMLDIFSDPVESAARINRDLMRIYAWGVLWNVSFNPAKTNYMIVTNLFIAYPTLYLYGVYYGMFYLPREDELYDCNQSFYCIPNIIF